MLRASFIRAARVAAARPVKTVSPFKMSFVRAYSTENGLARPEVETRIIDVLKSFDKVSLDTMHCNDHY